jgi:glycerol-3-phosphate dehydrogenase
LIGTTDIDDSSDPDSTHPTDEEIDYLIEQASRVFPGSSLEKKNHRGLRGFQAPCLGR